MASRLQWWSGRAGPCWLDSLLTPPGLGIYCMANDSSFLLDADGSQEAIRARDEFLAMLAHELRNPLAPILNAAQIIRLHGITDPTLQRALEVIERQAKQMGRLLDDLL